MVQITEAERKEFVDAFRELSTETGVDGVPRLVALFSKRNGDVGLSLGTLTEIAREALQCGSRANQRRGVRCPLGTRITSGRRTRPAYSRLEAGIF